MSFTTAIKKEITQKKYAVCCSKAFLAAVLSLNGVVKTTSFIVEITTSNPATARFIFLLLKKLYSLKAHLRIQKKFVLKKNYIYILTFDGKDVLYDLGFLHKDKNLNLLILKNACCLSKKCCKKAYLAGSFVASGSINDPNNGSYHLEIASLYYENAKILQSMMNDFFNLNSKIIERKKGFVVYLKIGEKIGDFLNIIGAHPSLLKFEDIRILKDMRNSVNRIVNCETANLNKVIKASLRQVENIQFIDKKIGINKLPLKLKEVATARLLYPDLNLRELGFMLKEKLSKSTVSYRLKKIEEFAAKLKQGD